MSAEFEAYGNAYRLMFEHAAEMACLLDLEGRFLSVNPAGEELTGYPAEELAGRFAAELIAPELREEAVRQFRTRLQSEQERAADETVLVARDGTRVPIEVRSTRFEVDGRPVGVVGLVADLSERKGNQEAVAQSEARLAEAQHIARIGSWESEFATGRIVISQELGRLFELDPATVEVRLEQLVERIHPDDHQLLAEANQRARRSDAVSDFEYRVILADGSVRWIHARGEPLRLNGTVVGRRGTSQDITERKQAEAERDRLDEQFHQAQKLEAVGQLAGGIAHDFNNMLTAIKGYSELLLNDLEPGTPAHVEAAQIQRAAEQASTLPAQLLAFGRAQPLESQLFDLNALLAGTSGLLEHLLSEAIELVIEPAAEPLFVRVDSGRIQTALVNLALNARDAMPAGGTLTIRTSVVELAGAAASEHQVPAGTYSLVSVIDDGEGMDAETAARAFEPFFTTKPQGQGSGLGLASVYGTVRQSGGFVRLNSRRGVGTTIQLHLPVAEEPAGGTPPQDTRPAAVELSTEMEATASEPARGRIVLVAEDEDVVRELIVRILRRDGYLVHAAASGIEALDLLDRLDRPVDVLLTDMVMPGMGGRELAEQALQRTPDTPVVFMSGYTEDAPTIDGVTQQPAVFLTKPFSSAALRNALSGATAAAPKEPISCLIVDDHPTVLDAVSRHLESAGIRVIGRVARADLALTRIEALRPATALIDIAIAPFDGIELARQAVERSPETGIVLYTGGRDPELLRRALEHGLRGFVVKDAPLSDVVTALTAVASGEHFIDAALAATVMATPPADPPPRLTSREQEVLELLATGSTNERAAAELGISPETVQSHVKNAMHKLDAETRTQAVALALRHSLID